MQGLQTLQNGQIPSKIKNAKNLQKNCQKTPNILEMGRFGKSAIVQSL